MFHVLKKGCMHLENTPGYINLENGILKNILTDFDTKAQDDSIGYVNMGFIGKVSWFALKRSYKQLFWERDQMCENKLWKFSYRLTSAFSSKVMNSKDSAPLSSEQNTVLSV